MYFFKTFKFAINGLIIFFQKEKKAWFHLFSTMIVIAAAILLKIKIWEWCIIIFAIGFVFVTEIINTAVEILLNKLQPDYDRKIGLIKDISASAVLVAAVVAFIIGLLVFIPYLTN